MFTLVRWAPFRDFDVINRRMRWMLEDFGVAPAQLPAAAHEGDLRSHSHHTGRNKVR